MKKLVSLLLTAMLFAAMLGVPAMAEDAVEIEASESGVLVTDLSDFYSDSWTPTGNSVWSDDGDGEDYADRYAIKSTGTGTASVEEGLEEAQERVLFLKFVVPNDIEDNQKVTLRLGATKTSNDVELVAYRVLSNTWGTPQKNADGSYTPGIEVATHCVPSTEQLSGTVGTNTTERYWFNIDVTNLVKRSGTYTIAVKNTQRLAATLYTTNAGSAVNKPKLVIETNEGAQPASKASIEKIPASNSGYLYGNSATWYATAQIRAGATNAAGQGIIRFTIPEVPGTISNATLNLTADKARTVSNIYVYKVDNTVLESTPEEFVTVDETKKVTKSVSNPAANDSISIDVTSLINKVGTVTFALSSDATTDFASFHSHIGATVSNGYSRVDRQPSLTIEYTPDEFYYIQDETTKTASNVTRSIKLINNNNEGTPVSIIAQYDGSGKLIAADVEKFTRDGWVESVSQNVVITGASSQVFLWRDLGNLIPIRAAE